MAWFCWSLLVCIVMIASTVNGQRMFPGQCGMSHPCAQICKNVPGMGRVKCECESGHILAANGFLCISEEDETIDIDAETSPTEAVVTVSEETVDKAKDQQGSGGQEMEGSGSGTDEDGEQETGSGEEIHVPSPMVLCQDFECQNGGTCYVDVVMDKAMCRCTEGFKGDRCAESVVIPPTTCEGFECQNAGTCYINGETSRASCHCPLGYEGEMCKQTVAIKFPSFQSHSYMEFSSPLGLYRTFQVRVDFKPETLDGLLLFCGEQDSTDKDYFSLGLVDGKMQFKYDLGGTAPGIITSAVTVSLGKWHTVTINRDNWDGWIQVDQEKPVKGKSKGLYSKLTLRSPLYLGGHSNYTAISQTSISTGFSGCVERLVINNVDSDMRLEPRGFAVGGVDVGECSSGLCDEGMCSNGGSCVAQSASRYLCLCPLGTAGPTCEKDVLLHIPSFNGSSHLVHQSLGKNHLSFLEIEVIFRPHQPTGMLLYSGQKFERAGDFVSLGMSEGHVEFRFDCGSGPAVLRTTEPVSLNEWHIAIASRTARDGTLQVDKRRVLSGMAEGAFTQLTFAGDLYIGGVDDASHVSKKAEMSTSFVGDIQKVIINDKPLDLIDDAIRGANVMNADHPCVDQPCQNRGECAAQHATYSCQCPLWYQGINCEEDIEGIVEVPSFQGSSYLRFTSDWVLKRVGGQDDNIQLEFRTWSSDGLILWMGRDVMKSTSDFMALGLDNGMLKWSYNLGGGPVSILTNQTFNDGEWHTVSMQRQGASGTLMIDQREGLMATAPGPMKSLDINNGLYLGGMKDVAELSFKRYTIGFLGCIRNVMLEGDKLDLYQDPSEGRNVNHCA
ncbi:pikachurin-like [Patiria miniata]|uniref:Pikachurin-like n=1 Tax=Patiria miniata TaxID=46514 RepID=A0A914BEQ8_PATMI|nr:pikachurin-like [Patiria miniata]